MKMDYNRLTPSDLLVLHEPAVSYSTEIIHASRRGVSRNELMVFAKSIQLTIQSLAKILPSSYSSLTKKDIYDCATSERIFQIAEIYAFGIEVFGSLSKFNSWIFSKNVALGGEIPFYMLDTHYGIDMVKTAIGRIDHGIFA